MGRSKAGLARDAPFPPPASLPPPPLLSCVALRARPRLQLLRGTCLGEGKERKGGKAEARSGAFPGCA